jgi:dethiobiotin synthetase
MSRKLHGIFVTATGTDSGKTFVTRGLARLLRYQSKSVAAVKPIETGTIAVAHDAPSPTAREARDATALARACDRLDLAAAPGLYRAAPPLAPYAATLATGAPGPDLLALTQTIRELASGCDVLLVEGAGGLLVPLDREHSLADLAQALDLPLLLVAPDALGVLSHVLTAYESAERRGLRVSAVILSQHSPSGDESRAHNQRILAERLPCPVLCFPCCADDDEALARAAETLDLPRVLGLV